MAHPQPKRRVQLSNDAKHLHAFHFEGHESYHLEGDASFFWQCVARHQGGGVISGISGLVPVKRDAAFLFGQAARSAQPAQLHTRLPVCPPAHLRV